MFSLITAQDYGCAVAIVKGDGGQTNEEWKNARLQGVVLPSLRQRVPFMSLQKYKYTKFAAWNFSSLKRIKTLQGSNMIEERLTASLMLSIEKEIEDQIEKFVIRLIKDLYQERKGV